MSLVKRHPIIAFFVLAYALAWIIESPLVFLTDSLTDTQGLVLTILSANVPSLVAIVLTAMVFGRGALRKLLGRLLTWRVNPLWYLGGGARACRPRRGHGCLEYPPWRSCPEFGYAPS